MVSGIGSMEQAQRLVEWYKTHARSFLEKHCAEKVEELDRACTRLQNASTLQDAELSVCFLGSSGVGKSTLINALSGGGQAVVPSGGVGPLTAQALTVRYGARPKLAAVYHSRERLNQLVFGLENSWKLELGTPGEGLVELIDEEGDHLTIDMVAEAEEDELANRERQRRATKSVAELLITGRQSADVSIRYLVDGLRDALGHGRPWATQASLEDGERITRIRAALALAKKGEQFVYEGTPSELAPVLNEHACGFLAPLIKTATVWWNASLLQSGITLVDLPGLGVIGDPRPEITRKFIRESAKALVLVVDHRGVTEAVAQLLRQSEFLNKLLHTSDEPDGNPVLLIAVTKVDDIARTRRLADRSCSFATHFANVCEELVPFIRNQLRSELESLWKDDGELHRAKQDVIDRLLATLRVHPVSAVEFEALTLDEGAKLQNIDQTNIPAIAASLREIRSLQEQARDRRVESLFQALRDGAVSQIKLVEAKWTSEDRLAEEIDQLRKDFDTFIMPLRTKFATLQGQYREFLRQTAPQRIADLVTSGKERSRNQIGKYLRRIGTAHWATLRASVRKGGRFSGATDVNLQQEFALRCEEPLAEAWGQEILKDIRRRTNEYADQCVELVEQTAEWAMQQGARVQQNVVEAQKQSIKNDAARLKTVGREMIKEVREKNSTDLINAIDGPIRLKCKRFVEANLDVGPGVRNRILVLFDQLADEIPDAAEKPALRILTRFFGEVEEEILLTLEEHKNPLDSMAEAIVASQEQYRLRSDAQKRKPILEQVRVLLSLVPSGEPVTDSQV
jgi:GTP-binding protein EngB required for normal cell division